MASGFSGDEALVTAKGGAGSIGGGGGGSGGRIVMQFLGNYLSDFFD